MILSDDYDDDDDDDDGGGGGHDGNDSIVTTCHRSVVKGPIDIPPPVKTPTPYGGVLVWTMPGQTKMHVHLKNKNLIRHRKRWSQVSTL